MHLHGKNGKVAVEPSWSGRRPRWGREYNWTPAMALPLVVLRPRKLPCLRHWHTRTDAAMDMHEFDANGAVSMSGCSAGGSWTCGYSAYATRVLEWNGLPNFGEMVTLLSFSFTHYEAKTGSFLVDRPCVRRTKKRLDAAHAVMESFTGVLVAKAVCMSEAFAATGPYINPY